MQTRHHITTSKQLPKICDNSADQRQRQIQQKLSGPHDAELEKTIPMWKMLQQRSEWIKTAVNVEQGVNKSNKRHSFSGGSGGNWMFGYGSFGGIGSGRRTSTSSGSASFAPAASAAAITSAGAWSVLGPSTRLVTDLLRTHWKSTWRLFASCFSQDMCTNGRCA